MKKTYKLLAAALFLTGLNSNISAQLTITGYGPGYAGDISNNGISSIYTSNGQVFKWDETSGLVEIGSLANGGLGAGHAKISEDGKKIAYLQTNPTNNLNEMSIYDLATQTWSYLGGISQTPSDGQLSSSWGMSPDGKTIVGLGWISAGAAHAIRWDEGVGMVDLGSIVEGRSSRANAISANKQVVVGWQDEASGTRRGARWVNGVEEFIVDQNGNRVGEAGAVSNDGRTILVSAIPNPKVWKEGIGTIEITHPNAGQFFRGGATDISGDGKTVIGFFRQFPGPPMTGEGFIWTEEKGRLNLNDYATSLGIDTQGVKMSLPLAISNDGKKIAGTGMGTNGQVTFVLDLTNYLGVNEIKANEKISVYPNPVKNLLNINAKNISHVEIYNAAGQKIQASTGSRKQLDVSTLPKGVYVIKITSNNNTQTTKFIKE